MVLLIPLLILVGFAVSFPATVIVRAWGRRAKTLDTAPVPGQIKAPARAIPNVGGVGIFLGFALPVACGLAAVWLFPGSLAGWSAALGEHLPGIQSQTSNALVLLGCLLLLHVLGLIDDRRPLGPFLKLVIMVVPAAAVVTLGETRLLTFFDAHVGGPWLSILITVIWFVVVTNAMNFIDNMDGLSGGVGAIAGALFLAAAVLHGQWFVAACLALLVGSLLGFLIFNFPPATIFMGDGGSLVLGFLLAYLTTRTTFLSNEPGATAGAWYGVLMPLIVLAVPLYDFTSVTAIRLSQGRSPFVGDLNHVSHRMVRRGLSKRAAILVIYGFTAITGISGLLLGSLAPWQAVVVGAQVLVMLIVVALFEFASGDRKGA